MLIFCQHKSTFHKETVDDIRVTAIPFYMGFADESELHWVSYVHQMMHNFFSVKLQCTPLAYFWCIQIYISLISGTTVSVKKIRGNKMRHFLLSKLVRFCLNLSKLVKTCQIFV